MGSKLLGQKEGGSSHGASTHSSPNTQERLLFFLFLPDSSNARGNESVPRISMAGAQKNSHNFIPKVPTLAKVLKSALQ